MKINAPIIFYTFLFVTIFQNCKNKESVTKETNIPQGYRPLELSIPSGLYYQRDPEDSLDFTVDSILPGLNIFTSNNDTASLLQSKGERSRLGKKKTAYLLGIPTLFNVTQAGDITNFEFGPSGADDNGAAAIVHVQFNSDFNPSASQDKPHKGVGIFIRETEILEYTSSYTGPINGKKYLSIDATNNNKAKISIDTSAAKGKVMVCIIQKNPGHGPGKLLGILNPKNTNNIIPEFIVKVPVYIIPFIVPNNTGNYGLPVDLINFSVGDPKVNGSVTASEE